MIKLIMIIDLIGSNFEGIIDVSITISLDGKMYFVFDFNNILFIQFRRVVTVIQCM